MAASLPDWDADSPQLRRNLDKVSASIQADAEARVTPTVEAARVWQCEIMSGLAVGKPAYAGRFRGEPGLERCAVHVNHVYGADPWDVQRELAEFEAKLQRSVAGLDAMYPTDASLDDDGMSAGIELAAWAHAEWVRIHPFANGNGRTARVWANLLLMRYGLPPVVTLRPRPGGRYGVAGAAAMTGDREPTVRLFRRLVHDAALNPPRSTAAEKKKPPKPTEPGK